MTEIAIRDSGAVQRQDGRDIVDGWLGVVSDVIKLANVIAPTEFVPAAYRDNPPAVAAAVLAGRELDIGPMTALRHVQVVKGTPTLSAEYKRARVLAAGHEFDVLELNTQRCRVAGRRRGSNKQPLEITFTIEDAKRAGLLAPSKSGRPGAWQTRPRRMLFARACSELCDFLFADVVNGLPTSEVVAEGGDDDEFAGYDEPPAKPAARSARRRTAAKPADPGPAPAPGPEADREPPQPPLPGEEDEPQDRASEPGELASRGLVGVIRQHFTRLGYGDADRDSRLAVTARLAGLPDSASIDSTSSLTASQARAVADTLARCKDYDALAALLETGEADA